MGVHMENENNKGGELLHISVDNIGPNPENPRLIFDQDKLDILAESISEVGILLPLVVFREDKNKFILLDGERRWRCARTLNLATVPANIIPKPTRIQNLLTMFNIHNVREDWELMPTALKLGELIDELDITNERRLSELTALKVGTIRRCKILLNLPRKYQKKLLNREYKPDLFIEMEATVLRKLEKHVPELYQEYGRNKLIDIFVQMYDDGKIKAVTDFRFFQKVIQAENIGLEPETVEDLIEKVVVKQELDFKESYEVIEDLVSVSKVEQKVSRLSETFRTLNYKKMKKDEKKRLRATLIELRGSIDEILKNL